MTNTQNKEEIRNILKMYLEGTLSFSRLKYSLKDSMTIDFDKAQGKREISNIKIDDDDLTFQVKKEHLRYMLKKYISGEIDLLELSNWAAFIYTMPNFIPEGKTEEEQWQEGESDLWDMLQQLVVPEYDFDVNKAHQYLDLLSL